MRSAERRKVNVIEMKCSRSLFGVFNGNRVRNEEVRWRDGMETELGMKRCVGEMEWKGS